MKLLIDMNLSPTWLETFAAVDILAVHWSSVGSQSAKDSEIFTYAVENGLVIFTHDLDFGTLLAQTGAHRPSVVQARVQDVTPQSLGTAVIATLQQFAEQLEEGAIVTILPDRSKVRILPI